MFVMTSLDEIFDILSSERRRYAIYYLHEQNGPVAVEELANIISKWEDDPPTQDSSWDEINKLQIDLIHNQLPKTAEVEFVQYHPEQGTIQVEGTSPETDAIITIARVIERPEED